MAARVTLNAMVIGDSQVGKSTLIQTFIGNNEDDTASSDEDIYVKSLNLTGRKVSLFITEANGN